MHLFLSVITSTTSFLLFLTQCAHGWLVDCDSQLIIVHRNMHPPSNWWSDICSNVIWYGIRTGRWCGHMWASSCSGWRFLLWVKAISKCDDVAFNGFLAIDSCWEMFPRRRKVQIIFLPYPVAPLCHGPTHTSPDRLHFTAVAVAVYFLLKKIFFHILFESDILKLTNIDSCSTSKQLIASFNIKW